MLTYADVCWRRKVVQKIMNGSLVSSFERWRDHTIKAKRLVRAAQKVMSRWMKGSLVSSWLAWEHQVAEADAC